MDKPLEFFPPQKEYLHLLFVGHEDTLLNEYKIEYMVLGVHPNFQNYQVPDKIWEARLARVRK